MQIIASILIALSLIAIGNSTGRVEAIAMRPFVTVAVCGDGLVTGTEICDLGTGNNVGSYASSTTGRICAADCISWGPYCGDSTLQVRFGEQCDDGDNEAGDLCDVMCTPLTPVPPGGGGAPAVGSTPFVPGAPLGSILSEIATKVVLRGKAYPNSTVNILLDGKLKGTAKADAQADFIFSTTDITPGTATFGVWAKDPAGADSTINSVVFEVVQSAVTTVANIFLPPTTAVSSRTVAPGDDLTVSGYAVPNAGIEAQINPQAEAILNAQADGSGKWALRLDTSTLSAGAHSAKALFELSDTVKSGFGRSVSFTIGDGVASGGASSADVNGDKRVNLVDFSIFLLSWGGKDIKHDFNLDGTVNLADFSILLFNWTG